MSPVKSSEHHLKIQNMEKLDDQVIDEEETQKTGDTCLNTKTEFKKGEKEQQRDKDQVLTEQSIKTISHNK